MLYMDKFGHPAKENMKRKVAKVGRLRLSPNEEAKLLKEEHERRRKLRLQQVREQERCIALQIRSEVQRRRDFELQHLAHELQEEWQRQQRERLQALEKLYQDSLNTLGEGHQNAKENEPDLEAMAQKAEEQKERAAERHREAVKVLKTQRLRQQEKQTRHIQARRRAILVEKERAAKVASLPPPSPEPFEKIETKKPAPVKMSDIDNFTVTHFHMPVTAVDREEDSDRPDARRAAEEEGRRLEELGREEERERREQLAKARLRGSHALRKEHLNQDRRCFLQELERMQQADLLRRRQAVSQMPPQTFQPLHSRQEMREDKQRDLEFAFEDMYTGERRIKGDLVLQLVPEPLPAMSSDAHDEDLDVTLEPEVLPAAEGEAQDQHSPLPPAGTQAEPQEGVPPHALKKLLDKIRSQRSQWSSRAGSETAADGMTIESGSLASRDRGPGPPPTTAHPAPTLLPQGPETTEESIGAGPETTEESISAGTSLPPRTTQADGVITAAEEKRKQAEELEKQRQEQVELLQRLEEERRSLEIQMQEAQLERARLQAAVGEHPEKCAQQELPVQEQEVPSPAVVHLEKSPEASSSVADDAEEHAKRIRQYQQRLLDQNRQHKRSVQEARHRLAEYQHALKMRHSRALMTALSPASVQTVPAPAPTAEILHRPRPPCAPAPAQTLPPASSTVSAQGPVPLPRPDSTPNLRLGISHLQSSDPAILSQSVSHMPAQDPRQIQQTPLPHPTSASEPSQPAQPPLEHGSETRLTSPALQQADTCPTSGQSPPATPGVPILETLRPAPMSAVPHSQPRSTSPTSPAPEPVTEAEPSPAAVGAEPWRRELEEARERVERQRLAVLEQQKEQEERLLRQQSLLQEQMRRHRQALDSFLTGAQVHQSRPVESGSDGSKEHRLGLMSSLLRAIEESNDSLSQPQGSEPPFVSSGPSAHSLAETLRSTDATSDLTSPSDHRTRLAAHTRAPRPPLARPKLGLLEIIEQHELSAIQEVETPNDASFATIGEESLEGSSVLRDEPEDVTSAEGEHWSGSSSVTGRSSRLSWRERLQLESGSSPEPDVARAACATQPSSDEGRGVVTPQGPGFLGAREEERTSLPCIEVPSEAAPADPEGLSSFTISSGSLSANEPDFSCTAIDVSLPSSEAAAGRGTLSPALPHSSMSSQGSLSPESLMGSGSIQRIIDKYTRELSHSLAAAGSFAAAPSTAETSSATWKAVLEQVESSSSITLPFSRAQSVPEGQLLTPETVQNAGGSSADSSLDDSQGGFGQIASTGATEDVSKCSFDGAQSSPCLFLPLEPRLEYDSSTSSGSRHSEASELLRGSEGGQVTGHLLDQSTPRYQAGRRDSTHSIGGPSAQSTSHWINEAQDISSTESFGPLLGEPSSQLLGAGQQATEWEELSEGQRSASSGGAGGAVLSSRLVGAPAQPGRSSEPVVHRGTSLPEPRPDLQAATSTLTQVSQSSDQDMFVESSKELQHSGVFQKISTGDTPGQDDTIEEDATLVNPSSDSFHPLPAEVTQNEMSEASMTFHPSMQDPHSLSGSDPTALTAAPSITTDPNTTLEPPHSPELTRGGSRDPSLCPLPSPVGSLCLPAESPCSSRDSILTEPPCVEDVSLALQSQPAAEAPPSLAPPPEGARSDASCHLKGSEALAVKDPENPAHRAAEDKPRLAWESLEAGSGTGILEEPDLTLLSLTESSVQELSAEEQEEAWAERKDPSGVKICEAAACDEDGESLKQELLPSHAVMLLERQWPSSNLQQAFLQRRQDFIQRSAKRLEELRVHKEAMRSSNLASRPKITLQGQRAPQLALPQPLAGGRRLKKVGEVKVCTPEHRKTEEAEMYRRTERLYNQLEEVKRRNEIRSRQESYAKNREKAKEFQKRTLQKLRGKQVRQ